MPGESFCHGALLYGSDDEFLAVVAPFLEEGLAAGEAALAALGDDHAQLIRTALPDPAAVTFVPSARHFDRPTVSVREQQELFASYVGAGAVGIRMVGEVPHPGVGAPWDGWARYEAAINWIFESFPLRGLCAYDLRTAPAHVVDDAERTHPLLTTADGLDLRNDRYQDPVAFVANRPRPVPDPLESEPPVLELVSPNPAAARHGVAALSSLAELDGAEVEDLILAVSEVVTNAMVHGWPPVTLRAWAGGGRVVVNVHDLGPGPTQPFPGLVMPTQSGVEGGRGLWMTSQLCRRVTFHADAGGFTVRLVAGSLAL